MPAKPTEIAAGVAHLPVSIANVYFIGSPGGPWVLIDSSLPGNGRKIREAAGMLFGAGARPAAILLTHGHFDHAGSALELANFWDVLIYAHPLELPYLTGKSPYPPIDPTAPGFMAFLGRFIPSRTVNLGERVRPLPSGGEVPGMPGWECHHTPGHAPGHIAFFRPSDATLIAGDAFTTMNIDNLLDALAKKKQICRPPTPITYDWDAARDSVRLLADLRPLTIAAGHGNPMTGPEASDELSDFAAHFTPPPRGRYVHQPARTGATGIVALPPAPSDPVPGIAAAIGVAAIAGAMFAVAAHRRKRQAER
jgi:glyoxylase-like metal-dependent hydrolase (beta-lactamase superfamily II)